MATAKDYYKVLGMDRSATAEEIRKAYRQLARKYHPDVNKADDAVTKFAEVQEAYDTLSDAQKRRVYDQYGSTGVGGGFQGDPRWARGGQDGFGGVDFSDIFGQTFGGGGGGSPFGGTPHAVRGQDRSTTITVTFMTALKGGVEEISVGGSHGSTVKLRIPKGIESGKKLRLKGKGEQGIMGGAPGDLLVTVTVGGHPLYQRNGLDVEMDVDLNIAEAALGVKVTLPLPLGGSVDVVIPSGVSSGTRLRVKGKGCVAANGKVGDFYAVIHIIAPKQMDEETKQLVKQLQQRLPNPREADVTHNES